MFNHPAGGPAAAGVGAGVQAPQQASQVARGAQGKDMANLPLQPGQPGGHSWSGNGATRGAQLA